MRSLQVRLSPCFPICHTPFFPYVTTHVFLYDITDTIFIGFFGFDFVPLSA